MPCVGPPEGGIGFSCGWLNGPRGLRAGASSLVVGDIVMFGFLHD